MNNEQYVQNAQSAQQPQQQQFQQQSNIAQRPQRGGFRGGRFQRGGRGATTQRSKPLTPQNVMPPLPPPPPGKPDLSPKKLSTKETPLKNDPMALDFDTDGFEGVTEYRAKKRFAITFEGFTSLIDRVYDELNVADKALSKNLSKSLFDYYMYMHLYARLCAIRKHKGLSTFREDKFVDFMSGNVFPLPVPIEEYLRGIGDIRDDTKSTYKLEFPAWPNQHGHFGVVSADTHWQYESMPAPRVALSRIIADYRMTRENGERIWNLPANIRCEEEGCGLPTRNLLGWAPAVQLSNDQLTFLQGCEIDYDHPNVLYPQFACDESLMTKISAVILGVGDTMKLGTSVHESVNGSAAQVLYTERDVHNEEEEFSRVQQYMEGEIRACTYTATDLRITIAALLTSFRVKKERVARLHSYACYDFNNYTAVPPGWIENRNTIFNFGETDIRWNSNEFRSAFRGKSNLRTSWIRKSLINKSKA